MPTYIDRETGQRFWFDSPPDPAQVRDTLTLVADEEPAPPREPEVPEMVEARQLLTVLHVAGLLDNIEQFVSAQPRAVQINWDRAIYFKRDHELLNQAAGALGMNSEQIDGLFVAAAAVA